MSDQEQLVAMGFDPERAALGLKASGNLQGALDWIEKHQDRPLDEIKAEQASAAEEPPELKPGEEAKSLVCEDCGKKFRSVAQAEFHGSKTGHENFAESTEEIAPLTEEEKKQRLEELKQKLAAKRAMQAEQDKEERKKNEQIRMKATKESQDIKEELRKKEQLKEMQAKKKEKADEAEARKRVLAKLEADKQELLLDAALLAAQVYEHRAEAHRLAGEEGEAEVALSRASVQRTNVDSLDLEMMNARVEVARQRRVVCAARGDEGGVKKAEREIKEAEEALDRAVVGQESLGEVEGEEVVEGLVEGGKSEEKR